MGAPDAAPPICTGVVTFQLRDDIQNKIETVGMLNHTDCILSDHHLISGQSC
jgi:hypothetical protein